LTASHSIAALLTVHVPETPVAAERDVPARAQILARTDHLRRMAGLSQIVVSAVVAMLVLGFYEPLTFAVMLPSTGGRRSSACW
jgi:hypothetical protein